MGLTLVGCIELLGRVAKAERGTSDLAHISTYSRRDLGRGIHSLDWGLAPASFPDQEEEEGLISTTVQMLLQVIKH